MKHSKNIYGGLTILIVAVLVMTQVPGTLAFDIFDHVKDKKAQETSDQPQTERDQTVSEKEPTEEPGEKNLTQLWWDMVKSRYQRLSQQGPGQWAKMILLSPVYLLEEYKAAREYYKLLKQYEKDGPPPKIPEVVEKPPEKIPDKPKQKPDKPKKPKKPPTSKKNPVKDAIADLYREHLGREPDKGGLEHYYQRIKKDGWDIGKVERSILNSTEYAKKHPKPPEKQPARTGTVSAAVGLNFRTGPGVGNSIISVLPRGTSVTILSEQNGWYKISCQGKEGWVCGRYIDLDGQQDTTPPPKEPEEPEKKEGYITAQVGLNVRNGPGVGNARIGTLPNGAKIVITGEQDGWYKITYQGKEGWVSAKYVGLGKPPWEGNTEGTVYVDCPQRSQLDPANGQYKNYWCGPTSLGMVYEYYGRKETTSQVADRIYDFAGNTGTYAGSIINDAKKNGFPNTEMKTGVDFNYMEQKLKEGKPIIVGVEVSYQYGHYMVVVGLSGNNVILNDPYHPGVRRVMSRSAFLTDWNGRSRRVIVLQK